MAAHETGDGGGRWRRTRAAADARQSPAPAQQEQEVDELREAGGGRGQEVQEEEDEILEGIASLALLPSGSLSGHFLHPASSTALGLFGTEIVCERECSRGEDYRLVNLTIIDFSTKKETTVVVERKGQDAARLSTTCDIHGWDEEVVLEANNRHMSGKKLPLISFECETLKADREAEDHVKRFLPSLVGCDAVVNIGRMTIQGLSPVKEIAGCDKVVSQVTRASKRGSEETLRLVFDELDEGVSGVEFTGSASKRRVLSAVSCLSTKLSEEGCMRSPTTHRPPMTQMMASDIVILK